MSGELPGTGNGPWRKAGTPLPNTAGFGGEDPSPFKPAEPRARIRQYGRQYGTPTFWAVAVREGATKDTHVFTSGGQRRGRPQGSPLQRGNVVDPGNNMGHPLFGPRCAGAGRVHHEMAPNGTPTFWAVAVREGATKDTHVFATGGQRRGRPQGSPLQAAGEGENPPGAGTRPAPAERWLRRSPSVVLAGVSYGRVQTNTCGSKIAPSTMVCPRTAAVLAPDRGFPSLRYTSSTWPVFRTMRSTCEGERFAGS
ncbi:MAG: hypothetical protein KatS3mg077_2599 [Candidatus Binatia bacterium]|nr:MAG: hypothetical protein KatS3mg077_2599 [Candidatus Binatia bacterium]